MPFTAVALTIAGLAGTGIGIGEQIYSAVSGGGGGAPSDTSAQQMAAAQSQQDQQQQQQQQQLDQQKKAIIAHLFPDLQEQLGGAVAPEYLIQQASTQAGFPGAGSTLGQQAYQGFQGLTADQLAPTQGQSSISGGSS